jgi:hypothetical protein
MEPTDFEYGERQYTAEDPFGHRWTFSQTLRDVAPEDWGGEHRGTRLVVGRVSPPIARAPRGPRRAR